VPPVGNELTKSSCSIVPEKHGGWLNVAMNHTVGMGVAEAGANINKNVESLLHRQWRSILKSLTQRSSLCAIHHEDYLVAFVNHLARTDDVRVITHLEKCFCLTQCDGATFFLLLLG
jgi:hypothetical protein